MEVECETPGDPVPDVPKYKGHPLAEIFPLIEGKDFEALVAVIRDEQLSP